MNGLREFWDSHDGWLQRIEGARRADHIGDMLVLADEAPVAAFRAEASFAAGSAVRRANRFGLALEQLERGVAIEPTHLSGLRERGTCLERLAIAGVPAFSLDQARDHDRKVLRAYSKNTETRALAAWVDMDAGRRTGAAPAAPQSSKGRMPPMPTTPSTWRWIAMPPASAPILRTTTPASMPSP